MANRPKGRKGKGKGAAQDRKGAGSTPFINRYGSFSYRLWRRRLLRKLDEKAHENLSLKLKRANMQLTPELYLSMIYLTAILVSVCSFIVSYLIFGIILQNPTWYYYLLGLTAIATVAALAIFPFGVVMRTSKRRTEVEKELPFLVSELSIMASTGLSPIEIIRRMSLRDVSPMMKTELKKVVFKADVEGKDIVTALGETARESPSENFREIFWDLSNMIHQGGNLDVYLRMKADNILTLRRDIQQSLVNKLATYADIYISGVVMMVLLLGVGAFLIDATGGGQGLTADLILLLLTYAIVPIAIIVIAMLVKMTYSKTE
jgi:flagellar protein FlaJ